MSLSILQHLNLSNRRYWYQEPPQTSGNKRTTEVYVHHGDKVMSKSEFYGNCVSVVSLLCNIYNNDLYKL